MVDRRLDMRRLLDLGAVLAALAFVLLGIDSALRLAFGPAPAFLEQREHLSSTEFDRIGKRLASAEVSLMDGDSAQSTGGLVMTVGLSTTRVDVDAPLLSRELCDHPRVLNLGSSGGSFRELRYYLGALEWTRLRPSLLVLGLHPAWLYGYTSPDAGPASISELSRSAAAGWDAFKPLTKRVLWAGANRVGVHNALTNPMLRVRARLANAFHLSSGHVFAPTDPDPWSSPIDYPLPRASDAFLAAQLKNWESAGWFDARRLGPTSPEILAVRQLQAMTQRIAGTTLVVLMPEASEFRARTPDAAVAVLKDAFAGDPLHPWIDLRDVLPDSLFYDNAHLTVRGREQFTTLLAKRISRGTRCDPTATR